MPARARSRLNSPAINATSREAPETQPPGSMPPTHTLPIVMAVRRSTQPYNADIAEYLRMALRSYRLAPRRRHSRSACPSAESVSKFCCFYDLLAQSGRRVAAWCTGGEDRAAPRRSPSRYLACGRLSGLRLQPGFTQPQASDVPRDGFPSCGIIVT